MSAVIILWLTLSKENGVVIGCYTVDRVKEIRPVLMRLYLSGSVLAVSWVWKLDSHKGEWKISPVIVSCDAMSLWHIPYFRNTFLVVSRGLFLRHYRHQVHDSSVLTWIFYWLSAQHLLTCLACNIPLLPQTVCHCTSASGASQCPPPLPVLPLLVFPTNKHHHS